VSAVRKLFIWPAVNTLTELGLVERVGMLLDGNDAEAEIIHPYGPLLTQSGHRRSSRSQKQARRERVIARRRAFG
jgi:hypothetical protein